MHSHLDIWGLDHVLQPSPQAHLIISHFSGRGSCICQTWKGLTQVKFLSSEDSQNIIIHPIYSFDNVDALSLDIWGLDHGLQPSPQVHLIMSLPSVRGSYIFQTWKGSTRGEFGSSEDGKNIIIHPIHSFYNVDALLLDVWGPDHVLQPSPQVHLIIFHFYWRWSCLSNLERVNPS
jgi:hypothetical protein